MEMMDDAIWFNNVGIVLVKLEHPPFRKYYIKQIDGYDQWVDIQAIKDWGSNFPKDAGDVLFGFATVSTPTN